MTTYQVHVMREGDQWLADVPELEGSQTYASSLTALDRYVREVIVLGADLPDEAMPDLELVWNYDIADQLVTEANRLREERAELSRREKQLQDATEQLAVKLTASGYSARDAGPLLGVSHQRISQYKPRTAVPARKSMARKVVQPATKKLTRGHTTPADRPGGTK